MNSNKEMLSYIREGCYYVYSYNDCKFITKIEIYNGFELNVMGNDVMKIDGFDKGDLPMKCWEIAKYANLNSVELFEFFPNEETMMKTYSEFFL